MARKDASESRGVSVPVTRAGVEPIKRIVNRSPGFVSIYANDVQVQTSPWDMRLIFGEVGDIIEGESPSASVTQVAELRVSPQLAKKLTMIMFEQLKAYEVRFGEIPVIKD